MKFDLHENKEVVALLGAGSMGMAIIRRIAHGKTILLGDISEKALEVKVNELEYSGYDVQGMHVDAYQKSSVEEFAKKAASLGKLMYFVDTAGASPNQAAPEEILKLDLVGTSYAIDAFGEVMAEGGAGLIIASMTGYMLPAPLDLETENALALTDTDKLLDLPCLDEKHVTNPGMAYILSKKANQLRVRTAAATSWGDRGARINTISPGIIVTPLAYDEFRREGNSYQKMIEDSAARRSASSDEIAAAAAFLLGSDASFITGTDLLVDGGVIAALKSGRHKINIR